MSETEFERRKREPRYWRSRAEKLFVSARVLWVAMGDDPRRYGLRSGFDVSHCWPVFTMLCGLALELLLKAIAVAKGQDPKPHHDSDGLATDVGVRLTDQQKELLKVYAAKVRWDGRYPVPKKAEDYANLAELERRVLFDEAPSGWRRPNNRLGWDSFEGLWNRVLADYEDAAR